MLRIKASVINQSGMVAALLVLSGCVTVTPVRENVVPCLNAFRDGGRAPSVVSQGGTPTVEVQTGHSGMVTGIQVTPDGHYAVVGETRPARVKLWNLDSGREVLSYPTKSDYLSAFHISADGRRVLLDTALGGGLDVVDLSSGEPVATCGDAAAGLTARMPIRHFSPDGLYGTIMNPFRAMDGGAGLEVWDIANGKKEFALTTFIDVSEQFSPDGSALVYASTQNQVQLYDLKQQSVLRTWPVTGPVTALAFSKDGATVFAVNAAGSLWAFDRASGAPRAEGVPLAPNRRITALAATQDGRSLVVGDFEGNVGTFDLQPRQWSRHFASAGRPAAALSPDGQKLFVATPEKLFLWRLADGRPETIWAPKTIEFSEAALFHPDGKRVAVIRRSAANQHVEFFDLEQKTVLWSAPLVEGMGSEPGSLSMTPDGKYLLASFAKFTQNQRQPLTQVIDAASGRVLQTIAPFPPGARVWVSMGVGLAGGRVAIATSEGSLSTMKIQIFDAASGRSVMEQSVPYIGSAIGASTDGKRVLYGGTEYPQEQGGKITYGVWSFDPEQRTFRLDVESPKISTMRWIVEGPNRQYVLGGIETNTGAASGGSFKWLPLAEYHPSSGAPQRLGQQNLHWADFSRDGSKMLWVGDDGFVHVRSTTSGTEVLRVASFDDGEWVLMTPEGFFDASAKGAQYITVRSGNQAYAIDQFYERLYRPDVVLATLTGKKDDVPAENLTQMVQQGPPPTVKIISPTAGEQGKRDIEVEVELTDAGGGIGRIEWRINGVVVGVAGERGLKAKTHTANKEQRREKRLLTLSPGDNRIEVVVSNAEGGAASAPVGVDLFLKDEISEPPSLHVLAIAINQYRDRSLKLSYAVPDAKSLTESFQRGAKSVFTKVDTTLVLDGDATAEKIAAAFKEMSAKVKSNDVFVLFVAGHGITSEGRYHFLPSDFRYTNEESIKERAINQDNIQQWMSSISAKKSLVLLDTCNSGSFVAAQAASRGITEKTAIDKLTRATGRATIAASTDSQVALEGYEGHGVFTWVVMDALLKADKEFGNHDGLVTTSELAAFINEHVPGITYKKWGYEQVPQVNLNGREFPIGVAEAK